MWRLIIGVVLLGCSGVPGQDSSMSFDEAKRGDEVKRLEFLDQLLGKLIYDKEKNPAGYVKAWYYMPSTTHKGAGCHCGTCAREALEKECKRDVYEMSFMPPEILLGMSFEKRFPAILKTMQSPAGWIIPYYRVGAPIGRKKCEGILLVGDLSSLVNEEEIFSAIEDYLITYAKDCEEGVVLKDEADNEYEMNPATPDILEIAHTCLVNLHARSVQIEKIASKARRISVGYRQAVVGDYLESHRLLLRRYAMGKDYLDNHNLSGSVLGPLMELLECMKIVRILVRKNLEKVGLKHREVNKETYEYALDGF